MRTKRLSNSTDVLHWTLGLPAEVALVAALSGCKSAQINENVPSISMSGSSGPPGMPGTIALWVTDTDAAAQFEPALLAAMPNTRVKARWGDATMAQS